MICVLAGGVGAARFLRGLLRVVDPSEVTVVVNVGDDCVLHGLTVCPDVDTIIYTLSGSVNPDTGWGLACNGSINYGYPNVVRFQGKGIVGGEEWIYDYLGFVVPAWPNGQDQVPAIVGTIVRTIPHSGSSPGTVSPAGVTASWIAVWKEKKP
jgi:hypothetical protein